MGLFVSLSPGRGLWHLQQASLIFVQVNGEMRDPSLKLEETLENSRSLNASKFLESFVHLAVALLPKGAWLCHGRC